MTKSRVRAALGTEGDDRRLMSLAHDPKGRVPTVEGEVLDVRPTGLAHPEAVESE